MVSVSLRHHFSEVFESRNHTYIYAHLCTCMRECCIYIESCFKGRIIHACMYQHIYILTYVHTMRATLNG